MNFKAQQEAANGELEKFFQLLKTLIPRYNKLLHKINLNPEELSELGDLEYFLIGVAGRVSEIKSLLEQDVFGHSVDLYYKLKSLKGLQQNQEEKLAKLRSAFQDSLNNGEIISLN